MNQILDGVKILDFTQFKTGSMGTQLLADLGAEVIKVERMGGGDLQRGWAVFGKMDSSGGSPFFQALNRNKKSIALDLKSSEAKEIIYRLVKEADVVSQNFRPGIMEKLGFGYEDLKKIKPDIIYCSNSGYGLSGPYMKRPGQDLLAQAISGIVMMNGDEDRPTPVASSVADGVTSVYLSVAILGALYYKKCTGEGQEVDVNLLNSLIALQQEEVVAYMNMDPVPEYQRSKMPLSAPWNGAPYGLYQTKDDKYMVIARCGLKQMEVLLDAPGLGDYEDLDDVFAYRDDIWVKIQERIKTNTREYWLEKLLAADVWCGQVNDFEEMVHDPQVEYNQIIQSAPHPRRGDVKIVGTPINYSKTPPQYKMAAPDVGEHSREILKAAGYSEDEISRMGEAGIVGVTD